MIKKIKAIITEIRMNLNEQTLLLKELEWAHVYHDSIRGSFIEKLPLKVGRWAGNYTFFYVLNRILSEYKPKRILEFGLGESTKMISTYLDHQLTDTSHTIIEENENWQKAFNNNFKLNKNSKVNICPLQKNEVHGCAVNHYSNLKDLIDTSYDLYIVDGPLGSKRYSRYDIINVVKYLKITDDFIILFDDCNRVGEQDTLKELFELLDSNKIPYVSAEYVSVKTVVVIASMKYGFVTSL